jgi:hypothetical protein
MKFIVAATIVLSFVALGTAELRGNHHRTLQTLKGALDVNPANNHRYEVYEKVAGQTWDSADTYAKTKASCGQTGHLVTIKDAAENDYVSILFESALTGDKWIGLNDKAVANTFAWVTGETDTYRNWNAAATPAATSGCVVQQLDKTWDIKPCAGPDSNSFVVEYDCTAPTCNWFTGIFQFLIGWLLGVFGITICYPL